MLTKKNGKIFIYDDHKIYCGCEDSIGLATIGFPEEFELSVFKSKIKTRNKAIPGCPFYNAGAQIGTDDEKVLEALRTLSQTAINYDIALVKALASANYLIYETDPEKLGRMMYNYIQGVMSFTHLQPDITTAKKDLPEGLYRLLGIKEEYWFTESPTWTSQPIFAK